MNTKQYYETVDAKAWKPEAEELYPDFSIDVPVLCSDGITKQAYYHFTTRQWYWVQDDKSECKPLNDVTHWLRPVSLSELIREVAGKSFDAGREFQEDIIYEDAEGNTTYKTPDKETYINSLINTTTNEQ